ncbi:MAG: beta-ketoacyl-ACP synthase II [Bacteroidales bacterium]|nr:beta-ketoacyl-ACP synthase II [Bacteroidales bacterium]MBR2051495.1 beta-ketoacyl-ACP synthase II [Bacteroidales bacterium]
MEFRRVVITGLGAVTPIGNTVPEYWDALCKGVNGAGHITRFDSTKFRTRIACEVKGFDPQQYFDRKEVRKLDLYTQFAIVASDEAISDSGITKDNTDFDNVGVVFSSGIGGINSFYEEVAAFATGDGTPRYNPFIIPKLLPDLAGGHISIKHGFKGPNFSTVSACASSANAIIEGYNYIRYGLFPVSIVGGSEAAVSPAAIGGFEAMRAMTTRNDDPMTASRPFDADRDGFMMGEGCGCLVLEDYEHALARGAKIYGEIVGCGLSSDAYHITAPHPEGIGAILCMQRAIKDAGIEKEDIDHINTHGTSTPAGDTSEAMAISKFFGEHAPNIVLNSIKSMTGHLLGGSGAIEAVATVLSLRDGIVPPTINHFNDDPNIDPNLDFAYWEARHKDMKYALSNAFGFGGHNASIIFKKYE